MRGTLLRVLPTLVRERGPLSVSYAVLPQNALLARSCSRISSSLFTAHHRSSNGFLTPERGPEQERGYKDFGHGYEPPMTAFSKFYHVVLVSLMLYLGFKWRLLGDFLKNFFTSSKRTEADTAEPPLANEAKDEAPIQGAAGSGIG